MGVCCGQREKDAKHSDSAQEITFQVVLSPRAGPDEAQIIHPNGLKENDKQISLQKERKKKIQMEMFVLKQWMEDDNLEEFREIVSKYQDIPWKEIADKSGNSLLHLAVKQKSTKIIDFLVKNKSNPNHQNKKGETPIHIASKIGDEVILNKILELKGDLAIKTKKGKTPLDLAPSNNIKNILKTQASKIEIFKRIKP